MKIILFAVNGSYTHTNLAIRCLRKPLENAGFEVQLMERTLRDREDHALRELVSEAPDIVGFSTYIWNVQWMLKIASDLKKVLPQCRCIFGGPEVSFETQRFDRCGFIDAIICGEGEEALPKLCAAIRDGKAYQRIIHAPLPRSVMADEGILYRENDYPAGSMLYYESSRGCPFSCQYCLSSAMEGLRYKSVEQTLQDLQDFEHLSGQIRIIKFVDRTFNAPVERANRIWRALLDEQYTKHYHFEVCASLLNEESFQILQQFPKGKVQLEFGLQSTNEETLQAVARHTDAHQTLEAVDRIYRMGNVHVHLDLIAGLPYEGYERFKQSFNEAYGHCSQLQLGFLKLLPGTQLRENAAEYGIIYEEEAPYRVLQTRWISYEELGRLSDIADLLERYHHSGRFERTMAFLTDQEAGQMKDPFGFYEGLADYIARRDGRHIQQIGQVDACRLLYEYAAECRSVFSGREDRTVISGTWNPDETWLSALTDAMHADFAESQNHRVPSFLQKHDLTAEKAQGIIGQERGNRR